MTMLKVHLSLLGLFWLFSTIVGKSDSAQLIIIQPLFIFIVLALIAPTF